jgi:hypothetical protein
MTVVSAAVVGGTQGARRDWWYEERPSDVRIEDKCPASSQYRWSRLLVPPETACSFVVTPVPPVPPGKQNGPSALLDVVRVHPDDLPDMTVEVIELSSEMTTQAAVSSVNCGLTGSRASRRTPLRPGGLSPAVHIRVGLAVPVVLQRLQGARVVRGRGIGGTQSALYGMAAAVSLDGLDA